MMSRRAYSLKQKIKAGILKSIENSMKDKIAMTMGKKKEPALTQKQEDQMEKLKAGLKTNFKTTIQ